MKPQIRGKNSTKLVLSQLDRTVQLSIIDFFKEKSIHNTVTSDFKLRSIQEFVIKNIVSVKRKEKI